MTCRKRRQKSCAGGPRGQDAGRVQGPMALNGHSGGVPQVHGCFIQNRISPKKHCSSVVTVTRTLQKTMLTR